MRSRDALMVAPKLDCNTMMALMAPQYPSMRPNCNAIHQQRAAASAVLAAWMSSRFRSQLSRPRAAIPSTPNLAASCCWDHDLDFVRRIRCESRLLSHSMPHRAGGCAVAWDTGLRMHNQREPGKFILIFD